MSTSSPRQLPVLGGTESLPPLFQRWMDDVLPGPIPRETKATCASCPMCTTTAERSQPAFHPDLKCCTYVPDIPNFLVGRILDPSAAGTPGRASIEERIAAAVGVTPLGLGAPPVFSLLYNEGRRSNERLFGHARALRCPHYMDAHGGSCGIWNNRTAVCATWFCKLERGNVGQRFWTDVRELLHTAEKELSLWCAIELGLDAGALRRLIDHEVSHATIPIGTELVDGRGSAAARRLWGAWHGREEEYYRRAAALVDPLSWDDVRRIGGSVLRGRFEALRDSYAALRSAELPERLSGTRLVVRRIDAARSSIETYSEHDPAVLTQRVIDVLHYFDGRSTSDAIDRIAAEQNVRLTESLVRRLVDYGILRGADAASA